MADSEDQAIGEGVARALVNKGVCFGQAWPHGRRDWTIYDEVVIAQFGDSKNPNVRSQAALAMVYKGVTLADAGRLNDAS